MFQTSLSFICSTWLRYVSSYFTSELPQTSAYTSINIDSRLNPIYGIDASCCVAEKILVCLSRITNPNISFSAWQYQKSARPAFWTNPCFMVSIKKAFVSVKETKAFILCGTTLFCRMYGHLAPHPIMGNRITTVDRSDLRGILSVRKLRGDFHWNFIAAFPPSAALCGIPFNYSSSSLRNT